MMSLPLFIAWSFIVFQQFSIVSLFFFIALKIHTCKLLKLQCSTIQHSSFPLEQLRPQRWFIKNMEKGNPFIFMETNIIMSVHFPLHIFITEGDPNSSRNAEAWLAAPGHSGYAQCETQATGIRPAHAEPPSCLHSLTAVAVWWKKYIYINQVALLLQGLSLPVVPLSIKTTKKKNTQDVAN